MRIRPDRIFGNHRIILVILGLAAIAIPSIATLAVEILVGWLFLISGIAGWINTFWRMGRVPGFWWSLVSAILGIAAGIMLLLRRRRMITASKVIARDRRFSPGAEAPIDRFFLGVAKDSEHGRAHTIARCTKGYGNTETRKRKASRWGLTIPIYVLWRTQCARIGLDGNSSFLQQLPLNIRSEC